jgi:hypothetical protein
MKLVNRTLRIFALTASFLVAAAALAGEPNAGKPGSEQRAIWCRAKYQACVETAKQPGFLGGALNWCTEEGCHGECQRRYGADSQCLSSTTPL